MLNDKNRALAEELLTKIGTDVSPQAIAEMFDEDVIFEVPGDVGALPWIGRKTGRSAVAGFISENRRLIKPESFGVHDILASETRAVVIGALAGSVIATGRLIETDFVIVLTISQTGISHFEMLEDSFGVSIAART